MPAQGRVLIGFSWDDLILSRIWGCSHFPRLHLHTRSSLLAIFSLEAALAPTCQSFGIPQPHLGRQVCALGSCSLSRWALLGHPGCPPPPLCPSPSCTLMVPSALRFCPCPPQSSAQFPGLTGNLFETIIIAPVSALLLPHLIFTVTP